MPSRKGKKGRKKKKKRIKNKTPATTAAGAAPAAAAPPPPVDPPYENLRFAVGDTILANFGYWKRGKITQCNDVVAGENDVPRRVAYKFHCEGMQGFCTAAKDNDWYIRAYTKEALLTLPGPADDTVDPSLMEQEYPAAMVG